MGRRATGQTSSGLTACLPCSQMQTQTQTWSVSAALTPTCLVLPTKVRNTVVSVCLATSTITPSHTNTHTHIHKHKHTPSHAHKHILPGTHLSHSTGPINTHTQIHQIIAVFLWHQCQPLQSGCWESSSFQIRAVCKSGEADGERQKERGRECRRI